MDKFHIELYPKADLENEWAKNKHTPGAMPCMRCGGPMRESLAESALSRGDLLRSAEDAAVERRPVSCFAGCLFPL